MRGAFQHDRFSTGEEVAHAITHGLGGLLSVACLVVMVVLAAQRGSARLVVGVTIFGSAMVMLYTASTLYHALVPQRAKRVFNSVFEGRFDSLPAFSCTNESKLCPEWSRMVSTFGQKGGLCVWNAYSRKRRLWRRNAQKNTDAVFLILF